MREENASRVVVYTKTHASFVVTVKPVTLCLHGGARWTCGLVLLRLAAGDVAAGSVQDSCGTLTHMEPLSCHQS